MSHLDSAVFGLWIKDYVYKQFKPEQSQHSEKVEARRHGLKKK